MPRVIVVLVVVVVVVVVDDDDDDDDAENNIRHSVYISTSLERREGEQLLWSTCTCYLS
jgi:hypothetical protein